MKCKDVGSYFYKNKKYRRLEKVISFQEFLNFLIWTFPENVQCFVGVFL